MRALRTWANDPTTDMRRLPPLEEESFDPETWQEFMTHVMSAIQQMFDRWSEAFARAQERARDPHELASVLVAFRGNLARWPELARHEGLPPPVRDALMRSAVEEITRFQTQLDKAYAESAGRGSTGDYSTRNELLLVVRRTPLSACLDYVNVDGKMVPPRPAESSRTTSMGNGDRARPTEPPRRSSRRIVRPI